MADSFKKLGGPLYTLVHKLGTASTSARLKSRWITFYHTKLLSQFRQHTKAGYLSQTSPEQWGGAVAAAAWSPAVFLLCASSTRPAPARST